MECKNISIFDNAFGGYGVGRLPNGKVVMVPFAVKGDLVNLRIKDEKKSVAYGEVLELIEKSVFRQEGFCKHLGVCGGCSYGFLMDNLEKEVKEKIVLNAFRFLPDFKIDEYITVRKLNYRVRCRMKMEYGRLAYKRFNSDDLVFIEECLVLKEGMYEKLVKIAATFPNVVADVSIIENDVGKASIYLDADVDVSNVDMEIVSRSGYKGSNFVEFHIDDSTIPAGATSFFQTNRYLLSDFQRKVVEVLENYETILELYCGSGFFTIPLSKKVRKITAIDNNPESIRLLKLFANDRVHAHLKDLTKVFELKGGYDTFLVNPDRRGLSKYVIDLILRKKPERVVYVSCDPNTMARDIKKLAEKYGISKFIIIDQFYKTYHVESIAVLDYQE